jgi:uncharacterized membrane protein
MLKFGGCLDLCTLWFFISLYCISFHIGDNVSFKFEVWTNILSVYLLVLFVFVYKFFCFAMLLIGHDLYHNYGLCVIGVFNLFEHCISLEISFFYSCVGLERLHLFN